MHAPGLKVRLIETSADHLATTFQDIFDAGILLQSLQCPDDTIICFAAFVDVVIVTDLLMKNVAYLQKGARSKKINPSVSNFKRRATWLAATIKATIDPFHPYFTTRLTSPLF